MTDEHLPADVVAADQRLSRERYGSRSPSGDIATRQAPAVTGADFTPEEEAEMREWLERAEHWAAPSRQAAHLRRAARRDATVCGQCGRALDVNETVYRVTRLGPSRHRALTVVGVECVHGGDRYHAQPPRPCEHCGRPVVDAVGFGVRRVFCSDRCEWLAASRRRSEATAPDRLKDCPTCGERFEATRADAVYCSPGCRQRAYRQRQAVTKGDTP